MFPPATATAPPLSSLTPPLQVHFFLHHQSYFSPAHTFPVSISKHLNPHRSPIILIGEFPNSQFVLNSKKSSLNHGLSSKIVLRPCFASISRYSYESSGSRDYDPELRSVLELATDSELYELERILFGPSYFSPLLKSVTKRAEVDHFMIGEDPDEREDFISMLESRFLFLAADARSTLRGWRPSYRDVLLGVRKKIKVPCSAKISTEDLEVEIFLHLLQEYSSEEPGSSSSSKVKSKNADWFNNLELGLSQWKLQKLAALGIGAQELRSVILKGGGMLTLEKLMELVRDHPWIHFEIEFSFGNPDAVSKLLQLGGRLSGKMLSEAAKYQMKKELVKKAGQLVVINLESEVALLAARQGLKVAATRYLGLTSVAQLLGPLMWGTLLADVVIQMLGTDYARILRAIYALAQIRIYRSYRTASDVM